MTASKVSPPGNLTLAQQFQQKALNGLVSASVSTAIEGGNFDNKLKAALKTATLDTLNQLGAQKVGDLLGSGQHGYLAHKIAHTALGCAVGAATNDDCESAVIGGLVGSIAGEYYNSEQAATLTAAIVTTLLSKDVNLAANVGTIADTFNRQLHQSEYDLAKKLATRKDIRDKLSKAEGYEVTEEELLGRIIREMNRNVDYDTSRIDGNIADWNLRALVGCGILQCSSGSQDPNYRNTLYNAELIEPNFDAYAAGFANSNFGLTRNDLIEKNIRDNPGSTGILGTQLMALGLATGNMKAITTARMLLGSTVGGGANVTAQYFLNEEIDPYEVGLAAMTGSVSVGQNLSTLLLLNTGNVLNTSAVTGTNPNTGLVTTPIAVTVGYGLGSTIDSWVFAQTLKNFADGKAAVSLLPGDTIRTSYGLSREIPGSELVKPSLAGVAGAGLLTEGSNRTLGELISHEK